MYSMYCDVISLRSKIKRNIISNSSFNLLQTLKFSSKLPYNNIPVRKDFKV